MSSGSSTLSATYLVPSEAVLIVAVDLPLPSQRQRAAALPFAVEDLVAEPLTAVHIALGAEIGPRRYLAGVAGHAVMAGWQAAATANCPACRIVPDVFALPAPSVGWSVKRDGGRVLVRCADGMGFAISATLLPGIWAGAGGPPVVSYGEALPEGMASRQSGLSPAMIEEALRTPALDLRQGAYAARTGPVPAIVRKAGFLVGAAIVLHCIVAVFDVLALGRIVDRREAEARAVVAQLAPGASAGDDIAQTLVRLLPGDATAPGVRFLPLFARTAAAMQGFADTASVQTLAFNAAERALTLSIEASDLATLQALEQKLREAGLDPVSGPATTDRGGAEFRITLHGQAS